MSVRASSSAWNSTAQSAGEPFADHAEHVVKGISLWKRGDHGQAGRRVDQLELAAPPGRHHQVRLVHDVERHVSVRAQVVSERERRESFAPDARNDRDVAVLHDDAPEPAPVGAQLPIPCLGHDQPMLILMRLYAASLRARAASQSMTQVSTIPCDALL